MVLVTGAGGTVGTELVKLLAREERPFRAAYHSEAKFARARSEGLDAARVDFARPETLPPALEDITSLFLLSPAAPDLPELEAGVVAQARACGIGRLVKLSVWRAPEEEYAFARWHSASEKNIQACGIPFIFLRPNSYMQNLSGFHAASIRATSILALPAGWAKASLIDVRDIAAVAARVLADDAHLGHAYDLSGPESLSFGQLAQILSVVLGRKITYRDLPETEFRQGMTGQGAPGWMIDALIEAQHYARRGQAADVLGSVQQIIGRRPISFERFARDYASVFL